MLRSFNGMRYRGLVASTAFLVALPPLIAQNCPDLPVETAPQLQPCNAKGFTAMIKNMNCRGGNDRLTASFDRRTRGFASGLEYNSEASFFSSIDAKPEYVTTDSVRGCRGESINIVITPGTISYLEYQLTAPNDALIADGTFTTWTGDRIVGRSVTLPQSGYYVLRTRTQAPAKTTSYKSKNGAINSVTNYPRSFTVAFRTDAGVAALAVGDKVDATVTATIPFIRRVTVTGGSKVRFRFASMGTGNFTTSVLRASGEQLHRSTGPVAFDEVLAVTPGSDEVFVVRAEPAAGVSSVGLQFSVIDDKAGGAEILLGKQIQSQFKLPAQYDFELNPAHKTVYATEMTRVKYSASKPERVSLLVRPSGASGLKVRVRVYDEATEDIILDERVHQPKAFAMALPHSGNWIVAIGPLSASEMIQAGDAKYTVELQSAGASVSEVTRRTRPAPARPTP